MVNDGKALERRINKANAMYERYGIASVFKVPTPTKVLKQENGKITEGFFEKGEHVDYVGVVDGTAIAFEAKSTIGETIDLKNNIAEHQRDFLNRWQRKGATTFVIIAFETFKRVYVMSWEAVERYYSNLDETGNALTMKQVAANGHLVRNNGMYFDYLNAIGAI